MRPTSTHSQRAVPPELDALATEFEAWRAQRPHRRTPTPGMLRDKAVALLRICRPAHIIQALGISHAMLKAWQAEPCAAPVHTAFVPLEVPRASAPMLALSTELTLANRSGQQVTLQGDFSAAQLALVVRALSESAQEHAL